MDDIDDLIENEKQHQVLDLPYENGAHFTNGRHVDEVSKTKNSILDISDTPGEHNGQKPNVQEDLCVICKKRVYLMDRMTIDEQTFHNSCLRCIKCRKMLSLGAYMVHNGVIYCRPHYTEAMLRCGYNKDAKIIDREDVDREDIVRSGEPVTEEMPIEITRNIVAQFKELEHQQQLIQSGIPVNETSSIVRTPMTRQNTAAKQSFDHEGRSHILSSTSSVDVPDELPEDGKLQSLVALWGNLSINDSTDHSKKTTKNFVPSHQERRRNMNRNADSIGEDNEMHGNIVRAGDADDEVAPPVDIAKNMAAKFRAMENHTVIPTPETAQKIILKAREGSGVNNNIRLPDAASIAAHSVVEIDYNENNRNGGVMDLAKDETCESEPVENESVVKCNSVSEEDLPEEGSTRKILEKFKSFDKS